ncbi:hypothetical protein G6F46_004642 [Rhizopus delemar]|uniref:PB1 domain-containing protein n=1 Tax=Rhizopus delemar (strain RA 99-880 / ATCC MYA-4621 / FGSC 9543 / NRRL 43880) TaxID=246409 RepID=I1CSV2_RHIO9|nr:hypothetical protein RO3G_16243 [Rhizopus delemar RA 99-880]KAG1050178.1 hypothetical protein G6F43_007527 [Rhizopus delemar]KAG1492597.1 hypothetical protein G6F54_009195 [Rhizopus delemar]KAG1506768.1 hypothetical protein G6F53_009448 [Rhizopus delemar]KAG1562306.1 hypothetical protein G6F49_001027 [Rhizopus delemar]|eukprot:EIE91532.1 hypothetical protein RO3G_16243 [Rhizopus delemar RA 99-880]
MSFRFEIEQWQAACIAFDKKEYETSLKTFINIADNSKIHFNIGLIFAVANEHDRAIASYNKAIQLDPYMAVAYFQRGVSYFIKNDMEAARQNFDQAHERLRGNNIINYHQLGLQFRLYACEVLFNRGICQLYMGKMDAGLTDLYYAQKASMTAEHAIIDQAVRHRGKGYSVFSIPPVVLFRPPENKLRQLQGGMFAAAVDQLSPKKSYRSNSVLLDLTKSSHSYKHHSSDDSVSTTSSRHTRNSGTDSGFESFAEDRYSSASSTKTSSRLALQYAIKEDEGYGDFDKELEEVYGSFNTMSLDQEKEWIKQRWASQEEVLQPSNSTSSNSSSTAGKLKIKAHYKDTRILLVSNSITFEELMSKIREKFNAPSSILLKYKDEENELVLLIDNDDLQIARQVYKRFASGKNELEKLELWCVDT